MISAFIIQQWAIYKIFCPQITRHSVFIRSQTNLFRSSLIQLYRIHDQFSSIKWKFDFVSYNNGVEIRITESAKFFLKKKCVHANLNFAFTQGKLYK